MRTVLESEGFSGVPPGLERGERLSSRLRVATDQVRAQAEARIGLAGPVAEWPAACLLRAQSFYRPLEARLVGFGHWSGLEIEFAGLSQLARLDEALEALAAGMPKAPDAPREALPHLPTFAHALGGLYAMATFSPGMEPAGCPVFGCFGETGKTWRLLEGLDFYGVERPESVPLVIEGAERTFVAIGRWMDARHWYAGA